MASSIASCTCPKTGAMTRPAGSPPTSPRASPFRPNPHWPSACSSAPRRLVCPSPGWWRIQISGHCPDLRAFLEAQGYAYALAVPSIEVICVQTQQGCLLNSVAHIAQQALGQEDWQPLSQSLGTKGERLFDWAILPCFQGGRVDGRHFLVVRRCLDPPNALAYYLVFAPQATTLSTIVQVIGARWHIEEDLQANKDLGLDQYEVRSYVGWYRHMTLVMLAAAFLVSICVHQSPPLPAPSSAPVAVPAPAVIALTTREVRHLLARLVWPAPTSAALIYQWSWWRRTHQYWAGYYHRRRREKASAAHQRCTAPVERSLA